VQSSELLLALGDWQVRMQSNYAPDAFGAAVTHASGAREALPRGQRARARASPAAAAPAPHAERKEAARLRARAGGGPGARGGGAGGGADGGGAALHRAGPDRLALEGAPAGARAALQPPSPPRLLRPALCLGMRAVVPARRPSRSKRGFTRLAFAVGNMATIPAALPAQEVSVAAMGPNVQALPADHA